MTSTFKKIANRIQGSYMVLFFFFVGFILMVIGINHFVEDTISSYHGVKMLEEHFGMIPTTYPFTYFTISISPQIAQIVFFYLFISDPRRNWWAFLVFLVSSGFDFYSDIWYRSDGQVWSSAETAIATSAMTFMVYTFGSELFISTGFGLVAELLAPAIKQGKRILADIRKSNASYQRPQQNRNSNRNQRNQSGRDGRDNQRRQEYQYPVHNDGRR